MDELKQQWAEVRAEVKAEVKAEVTIHQTFTEVTARKLVLLYYKTKHYFILFMYFLLLGDIEIFLSFFILLHKFWCKNSTPNATTSSFVT